MSAANEHYICPGTALPEHCPCALEGLHRPKPIQETQHSGYQCLAASTALSHQAPLQGQSSWGVLVCRAEFLAVDCCSAALSLACKLIPAAHALACPSTGTASRERG